MCVQFDFSYAMRKGKKGRMGGEGEREERERREGERGREQKGGGKEGEQKMKQNNCLLEITAHLPVQEVESDQQSGALELSCGHHA